MPKKGKSKKQDDQKLFAFLATFFTIIGFIIALALKKDDKYIMYYAKIGLVLFIGQIIIIILSAIPIIGTFVLGPILWIVWLIAWLISWIYALSGEQKSIPIISSIAEKIKF